DGNTVTAPGWRFVRARGVDLAGDLGAEVAPLVDRRRAEPDRPAGAEIPPAVSAPEQPGSVQPGQCHAHRYLLLKYGPTGQAPSARRQRRHGRGWTRRVAATAPAS